ncbi:Phosphoribosylformylglycinamidine cyclo-ligase [bacterium HR33]|nr:Phosphoribosylformylglycinamidine cyclo-ligase [bacterium HR33]
MTPAERYREAGVDLDFAEGVKGRIAEAILRTRTSLALGPAGGFGGMIKIPPDIDEPVAVLSTDGVGTKVLVAIRAGRHDTVGEDLVNHCVNDILVHGAAPLAFQDYIAGSDLKSETIVALVEGIARGCTTHGMTLTGGETAQLRDLYQPGHYDLAGTIMGVASRRSLLTGERTRAGDVLVGYASSGLHTNGYSLARRIVFDKLGLDLDSQVPELDRPIGEVLLEVHRSYFQAIFPVLDRIRALAHITGGGIPGNLPRSLPRGLGAKVKLGSWPIPPVFLFLQQAGSVEAEEMYRVFNMGIGMIAAVSPSDVERVSDAARQAGVETWPIGEVILGSGVSLV